MTDIVERLRDASYENAPSRCMEAAREIDRLRAALAPFAAVAESDIGQDETDADIFQPFRSGYNRAPLITVGDMRRAASAVSRPHLSTPEK